MMVVLEPIALDRLFARPLLFGLGGFLFGVPLHTGLLALRSTGDPCGPSTFFLVPFRFPRQHFGFAFAL